MITVHLVTGYSVNFIQVIIKKKTIDYLTCSAGASRIVSTRCTLSL